MTDWTTLGFAESWTDDCWGIRSGFTLQVFNVYPRISDILCGLFIGWEEEIHWWRRALDGLPPEAIKRARIQVAHHQNSGTACRPFAGQLSPVAIAEDMMSPVIDLCRHYYQSNAGAFTYPYEKYPEISKDYRDRVEGIGLTADHLLGEIREGVYPLDATEENVCKLLADPGEAVRMTEIINNFPGAKERLRLFVLADNSD
ncbi:hypothetical protein WBP06_03705 [Novosphingobium sp. BL-8H]|uniref:hypothetical protein n=1 Tax=Novosphingobium sp. BL-8H TaxID=3127640 RepID=UPI0037575318